MAYREPSRPAPRAPSGPTFTFRRYGPVWIVSMSAFALACVVGGLALYRPVALECRRDMAGTPGRCELVTSGVREWERAEVWEVEVQVASLGEDGPQPTLGVMLASRQMHWYPLGSRNAEIEDEWRAFHSSIEPRFYATTLDRSLLVPIALPGIGLLMLAVVLAFEQRTRVTVDREQGMVEVVRRGLIGAGREAFALENIERVDSSQMGDTAFYALRFWFHGEPMLVAEGQERAVDDVARALDGIVQSYKHELARRAKGE